MKTSEAPVTLHFPVNRNLTGNCLNQEEIPAHVALTVKSDLMESYEDGWPFTGRGEIISLAHEKEGIINFSIGTDGRLYLIKKDETGNAHWGNRDISAQLIDKLESQNNDKKYEVVTFNSIHSGPKKNKADSIAVMCCVAEVGNISNHEIWITPDVAFKQDDESAWKSLGKINGVAVEFMRMTRDTTNATPDDGDFTHIVCGRKEDEKYLKSYIYNSAKKEWEHLQFDYNFDNIIDLQFGATPENPLCAYVLSTYKGRGQFFPAGIYSENNAFKTSIMNGTYPLNNPAAFVTDIVDDESHPYGCSEIYIVDVNEDNANQIKFISAESLAFLDKGRKSNIDAINIGNSFKGSAKKILVTKNNDKRIDLYIHAIEDSAGKLLHIFNTNSQQNGKNKWFPIYTLRKDVSNVAPVSNAEGRICEIFQIGTQNDLRYLWQEDKLFSWHEDQVCFKATGKATPTNCVQTKITFTDAGTEGPIIFQKYSGPLNISIEASRSVNTQINNKKYTLNPNKPITIDAKELMGDLTLITNVTETDSPYFKIHTNFMDSQLIIHPLGKIQDDMQSVDKKEVKDPKDRFGDDLKIKLVEGKHAEDEYLDGVLPGVNQIASISSPNNMKNNMHLISNSPDLYHMRREGVWVQDKSVAFDTRLDLSSIENGVLFAIDFRSGSPRFLNSDECRLNGIKGLEGYDGLWEDLAKFFGAVIEAVKNTVEEVATFVVEKVTEGIQFTINFVKESFNCVVKFAEQVMETINMVLEKYLGIDLSKIIQWLGAIFDIDYILAIQKELVSKTKQAIKEIKKGVLSARTEVPKYFNIIKNALNDGFPLFSDTGEQFKTALNKQDIWGVKSIFSTHNIKLEGNVSVINGPDKTWIVEDSKNTYTVREADNKLTVSVSIGVPKDMQGMTMTDLKDSIITKADKHLGDTPEKLAKNKELINNCESSIKCDPVMSWGVTQFQNLSSSGYDGLACLNIEQSIPEEIIAFLRDELIPSATSNIDKIQEAINNFVDYIKASPRTLLEIFDYICRNIINFGLEFVEQIIDGLLKVIEKMVQSFEDILTKELV